MQSTISVVHARPRQPRLLLLLELLFEVIITCQVERNCEGDLFGYNKPQLMAIVFCHKERGISVEEENHLVTVGIVKKSKTILVLLASPIVMKTLSFRKGCFCRGGFRFG